MFCTDSLRTDSVVLLCCSCIGVNIPIYIYVLTSIDTTTIPTNTTRTPTPRIRTKPSPRPPIRHISTINNTMVPRRKIVALAGRAIALIRGRVVNRHVVVLQHLADL